MSSLEKLAKAKSILEKELSIQVKNLNFEPKLAKIHMFLRLNNMKLFEFYKHILVAFATRTAPFFLIYIFKTLLLLIINV